MKPLYFVIADWKVIGVANSEQIGMSIAGSYNENIRHKQLNGAKLYFGNFEEIKEEGEE